MLHPLVAGMGIGLLGSVVAGPALVYGLGRVPQRWRRTAEWLLLAGAVVFAVLTHFFSEGPMGGMFVSGDHGRRPLGCLPERDSRVLGGAKGRKGALRPSRRSSPPSP